MLLEMVETEKAVGTALAHDVTRIVPGTSKGVGFKKGHIVTEADVPELLKLGKRHLYVLNLNGSHIHEDEAALRMASAVAGTGLDMKGPDEGKVALLAREAGLARIDAEALLEANMLGEMVISTLKDGFPVKKGQQIAAMRVIPLVIETHKIVELEKLAQRTGPFIHLLPYRKPKVGGIATGTEVYEGLIQCGFDKHVAPKFDEFGLEFAGKVNVPDDPERIAGAILDFKAQGCGLVVTTGGLSVDPDDVTREGIRKSGAEIIAYGSPVLPGAMFCLAKLDDMIILGCPACVYYHAATILDVMLPRILAGEVPTKRDIAALGHGGLCMNCKVCRYPVCPFGCP
ncbi:molybdopterin-binding protein [Salidesulfovibrio onnuriiensis]|uniref:molybdopterin-binding protein n=1 Tax=Salidesulfovibrio onnuriiensis TaxID=2583823 RepID=UPI001C9CE624|nr:molybdopterin-binding protein [Salidesulfovibrio onnuriiensis]